MDHMKSRRLSRKTKTLLYKTLIRPVLTYGTETWALSKSDEARLGGFERKILRKIYGAVLDGGRWRRRTNNELYDDSDLVKFIKLIRLSWAGHVFRLNESDPARKVLLTGPGGQRPRGRPKLRWEEGIEEDAVRAVFRNWKKTAANREEWRNLLKEALAHPGL
jgi:hypothetical protein